MNWVYQLTSETLAPCPLKISAKVKSLISSYFKLNCLYLFNLFSGPILRHIGRLINLILLIFTLYFFIAN